MTRPLPNSAGLHKGLPRSIHPKFNRRQILQAGSLGLMGLGLPEFWQGRLAADSPGSAHNLPGFGRAKACIFLFMWGGPSQLETFDPKPNAPSEIRGEFQPVSTRTTGIQISEHFQHLTQRIDKVGIIRSLTHDDPAHLSSAHATLTGQLAPVVKSDAEPPSDRDTPHIGSVMSRLHPANQGMPSFVTMPWLAYHPAAPGGQAPGQNGGWLGHQYDPFLVKGNPNKPDWSVPALNLQDGVSPQRLENRRKLLRSLDQQRSALEQAQSMTQMTAFQKNAFQLLTSPIVRKAFDLDQESEKTRQRYGRNIHGQCVLMARRLVEHGVPLVSVNWHNDGKNFWDTHGNNFNRMKNDLIPPADQALSALLDDLEERGLLSETIIAWVGEFGRRPQITQRNAGREHWPFCYNGLLAGGGIQGGSVYGASDKHAAYPDHHPVSPQDFTTTLYHALGVDTEMTLKDKLNRPRRLCAGKPILPLFS